VLKDENGIAVVMGHENAHAIAQHGNERMSQELALQMGGIALSEALKNKKEETLQLAMIPRKPLNSGSVYCPGVGKDPRNSFPPIRIRPTGSRL